MPIQFITTSYKGIRPERQAEVYRLLHIAFDRGYLFEPDEIESAWDKANKGWVPLPEKDGEIWKILHKILPAEIVGTLAGTDRLGRS